MASADSGGNMRFCTQTGGEVDPAFVAEMPEGGAELERVLRRAPRCGLAVSHQAGQRLVELLGVQCRAEFDDALDLAWSGIALRVRDAGRDDDRLAGSGDTVLAAQGEVGFARQDGEPLFLAGVDVLGDGRRRGRCAS